jgi:hypothetical protein
MIRQAATGILKWPHPWPQGIQPVRSEQTSWFINDLPLARSKLNDGWKLKGANWLDKLSSQKS